jgi:hypothetical protein
VRAARHQLGHWPDRIGQQSKKLADAARHWARGGKTRGADAAAELAILGIDAEEAKQWVGDGDQQELFEVYACNQGVLTAFLSVSTQWRVVAGMAGMIRLGLDYGGVLAALKLLGVPKGDRPRIFEGLRAMEQAALEVLNATTEG